MRSPAYLGTDPDQFHTKPRAVHLLATLRATLPPAFEALSLVSLEAAGAGLPPVVTRINGTDELVEDGRNGFFVEPNAADIAAKVRCLVESPDLRQRMSAEALVRSRAFTREAVLNLYDDLLNRCLRTP